MVIAAFLNKHLLEPRERRLRAEGFREGYALGYSESYELGYAKGFKEGLSQAQTQAQCSAERFREGLAQIQARARAAMLVEVRSLLQEHGFDPDEIPLPHADDAEAADAERR